MNYRRMAFDPGIQEYMETERAVMFDDLHVAMPGTIQEFDPAKRTAKVQPAFGRIMSDGKVVNIPQLVDVPVFTVQGGGAHIKFPVDAGDECLLIFSDSSIDTWFENGGQQAPPHDRMHSLADGFALVGFNSQANALESPIGDAEAGIGVKKGAIEAQLTIDPATGKVRIKNQAEDIAQLLQDLITAIKAITTTVTGDTVSPASQAALALIATRAQNLLY
jgi:hypothetical protein